MLQKLPPDISLSFSWESLLHQFQQPKIWDYSSTLIYDSHVGQLVSSCMAKLCQINRVKNNFDKSTLPLIISALVMSKLLYCSMVWSNTTAMNVKKIQAVQNFACRIITRTRKFDHITPALREQNWLPMKQQLFIRDAVMMFRCINNLAPPYTCAISLRNVLMFTNVALASIISYKYHFLKLHQAKELSITES